jgi:hypothetical protein
MSKKLATGCCDGNSTGQVNYGRFCGTKSYVGILWGNIEITQDYYINRLDPLSYWRPG